MKQSNRMIIAVLILAALVMSGLCLFVYLAAKPEYTDPTPPLFHNVDEIAADGEFFYTLDNTIGTVCKYSNDGSFQYAISFSYLSHSYIYVDENGALCLYFLGTDELRVYDDSGKTIETRTLSREEFENIRSSLPVTEVAVDGVTYRIRDGFFNSKIEVVTSEGTEFVTVESVVSHLSVYAIALFWTVALAYVGWTFYCFFRKPDCREKKSSAS